MATLDALAHRPATRLRADFRTDTPGTRAPRHQDLELDLDRLLDQRPRSALRTWLGLIASIALAAVGIALTLAFLVILSATAAQAQTQPRSQAQTQVQTRPLPAHTQPATLEALRRDQGAGLILQTTEGPIVAPLIATEAELRVTGPTLRAVVTHRFLNPQPVWMEGRYQFPLPEDAAVDHLRMTVGDRVIEGEIQEKQAARRTFAEARDRGQRAALVEQQRPNVFTTQVTNIAPGATIAVSIEYQQTVALKDGRWQLRLPGVVAPRYHAARVDAATQPAARDEARLIERQSRGLVDTRNGIGWDPTWQPATMHQGIVLARAALDGAADDATLVDEVDQPVLSPDEPKRNPMRIQVIVDPGLAISEPRSASHHILASRVGQGGSQGGSAYRIETLADEVADRDFVLEWTPAATAVPQATLRHERHGDAIYGLVVVNPPQAGTTPTGRQPRETTFVVDTSGSMGGESIVQARRALQFGLERLIPGDRFNIIQFNSRHSSLFDAPVTVDASTLSQAQRYVAALQANGGTEMRGAIEQALSAPLSPGLLGQVVFITDGAVDYEGELITLVGSKIGVRRLYTVGIGSAPNGYFMRKTAELGGGTFTFIGQVSEVEARMAALFDKLARPVYTDLAVTMQGGRLAEPIAMPRDLHAGEPLVLTARFEALPTTLEVSAAGADGRRWRVPVAVAEAPASGLHVRWARARIDTMKDDLRRADGNGRTPEQVRQGITQLALAHHLVSETTSLVAVDRTPARPANEALHAGDVPANLPAGWRHDTTFGQGGTLAATATPAALKLMIGMLLLAAGFALLLTRRGSRLIAAGPGLVR